MDSEKEFIQATQATVTKSILYVCLTVAAAFWFSSCQLEPETIQQCEESCEGPHSYMKSVTSRECECGSGDDRTTWVLPGPS